MSSPHAQRLLRALAWEARRRGVSYGILCSRLQPGEDEEILRRYAKAAGAPSGSARSECGRYDWTAAWELYNQGHTDREIAEAMGCTAPTVGSWRSRHGLSPNRRKKEGDSHG